MFDWGWLRWVNDGIEFLFNYDIFLDYDSLCFYDNFAFYFSFTAWSVYTLINKISTLLTKYYLSSSFFISVIKLDIFDFIAGFMNLVFIWNWGNNFWFTSSNLMFLPDPFW